jgi:ornithine cyclodeaminase/alanine dehydrogenase-like protein (mu-crystallin family)
MSKHKRTITRCHFVQGAAATALTLPALNTASASAADSKATPPSERITLGFIGVGTQNRGHLGHFLGAGDVQVLAVCDVDANRRNNAKEADHWQFIEDAEATKWLDREHRDPWKLPAI